MALNLHVDRSLEALADRLAELLAEPPSDPFQPELILVPSAGLRAWLTHGLAQRLSIAASIEFAFPASIIQRSINADNQFGLWTTNRLMWGIYHLMSTGHDAAGPPELTRARRIADLFDRYTNHRPAMVLKWSAGHDVDAFGQPLSDQDRWQPSLWRALEEHYGRPSDARILKERIDGLATIGPAVASLPERISLFGMTPASAAQLWALRALAEHRAVSVFAPTPSTARWESAATHITQPLEQPTPRAQPGPSTTGHPLLGRWGRNSLEGLAMFASLRLETEGRLIGPSTPPPEPQSLLTLLQKHIDLNTEPPEITLRDDERHRLANDGSMVWHLTYGGARQIEVLRDQLLHLLNERDGGVPRFAPRDIAILCADATTTAPLIEALFAGDPDHGVPSIPVTIADRAAVDDTPFAAAALALASFSEGRFRFDEVADFLANPVVAARYGLDSQDLSRANQLLSDASFRWGLTPDDQSRFGFEPLGIYTLRDGLNRLLVSAAAGFNDHRIVLGSISTVPSCQLSDVPLLGKLCRATDHLADVTTTIQRATTLEQWITALREGVRRLTTTTDSDAEDFEWVDQKLSSLVEEATWNGTVFDDPVPSDGVARLVRSRLHDQGGRSRFGTGRVTVSSLSAQRGVPYPVICLVGLDASNEHGSFINPDDLVAASPSIGDSDPRSERRAQLLDALTATGQRLILCSTGFDLQRSEVLPPATVLAELDDQVFATTGTRMTKITHPRHVWAPSGTGDDIRSPGQWSFDHGALAAAQARTSQTLPSLPQLDTTQSDSPTEPEGPIPLDELIDGIADPVKLVATKRLKLGAPATLHDEANTSIVLTNDSLTRWHLLRQALDVASDRGSLLDWATTAARSGIGAPRGFLSPDLANAVQTASLITREIDQLTGGATQPQSYAIDGTLSSRSLSLDVTGTIGSVFGDTIVIASPSKPRNTHLLDAWVRLLLLTTKLPETDWRALVLSPCRESRNNDKIMARSMTIRSRDAIPEALHVISELWLQAVQRPVPFFADVSASHLKGRTNIPKWITQEASKDWESSNHAKGVRHTGFNPLFFDAPLSQLIAETDFVDWATAIYESMAATVEVDDTKPKADDATSAITEEIRQWV